MNYLTWLNAPQEKRLTYVLGDQVRLRESVVTKITHTKSVEIQRFDMLTAKDRDVWYAAFSQPLHQNVTKVVVVSNAQLMRDLGPLKKFLTEIKNAILVFNSDQKEFSPAVELYEYCIRGHFVEHGSTNLKIYKDNTAKRTCKLCDDALRLVTYRGRLIDCSLDSAPEVLKATTRITSNQAEAYSAFTHSVDNAIEGIQKFHSLGMDIDLSLMSVLSLGDYSHLFVKELTTGRKVKAIEYGGKVPEEDILPVLTTIADWLSMMWQVSRHVKIGHEKPEIAAVTGLSWPQTAEYLQWVGKYPASKVDQCTLALAEAFSNIYSGGTVGVLPLLAAGW